MRFQKDTLIQAPPDAVFAYVADIARHPEWAVHRLAIESAPEGVIGVGSKYRTVGHQMGADSHDEVTVTEYDPPRSFVFESSTKDGYFRHSFHLRAEPGGTRVTKSFDMVKRSLPMYLFTPMILAMAPRQLSQDLVRIKGILERASMPT